MGWGWGWLGVFWWAGMRWGRGHGGGGCARCPAAAATVHTSVPPWPVAQSQPSPEFRSCLRACRWDEEVFGLEYDLDLFNIVAVDDFNMGEARYRRYRTGIHVALRMGCWWMLLGLHRRHPQLAPSLQHAPAACNPPCSLPCSTDSMLSQPAPPQEPWRTRASTSSTPASCWPPPTPPPTATLGASRVGSWAQGLGACVVCYVLARRRVCKEYNHPTLPPNEAKPMVQAWWGTSTSTTGRATA